MIAAPPSSLPIGPRPHRREQDSRATSPTRATSAGTRQPGLRPTGETTGTRRRDAADARSIRPILTDVTVDDLTDDELDELADLELKLVDSQLRVKELQHQLEGELRRRNQLIAQGVDEYGRTQGWAADVADISRATVHRALSDVSSRLG